jgi:thiamine biosynthesis lipoprotein
MATEFEVIIAQDGVDAAYARQVADALFAEVDRMEDELSRFRAGSDIWRINHLKAGERCPVGMATRDCLNLAKAVHLETHGAFDITIGPLMNIFRHADGESRIPDPEEEAEARKKIGMQGYDVGDDGFVTVHVDEPVLDLGAVGKGYTLDQLVTVLGDHRIENALLNAGDSTLLALGAPPGETGWRMTVGNADKIPLLVSNRAVSASGFAVKGAHIINPRDLKPVPLRPTRVWACAPTAALSDALSTAFMIMSREEIAAFCAAFPDVQACLD